MVGRLEVASGSAAEEGQVAPKGAKNICWSFFVNVGPPSSNSSTVHSVCPLAMKRTCIKVRRHSQTRPLGGDLRNVKPAEDVELGIRRLVDRLAADGRAVDVAKRIRPRRPAKSDAKSDKSDGKLRKATGSYARYAKLF